MKRKVPRPPDPQRVANANRAIDDYARGVVVREVRTPFDRVLPGMPPALRMSA